MRPVRQLEEQNLGHFEERLQHNSESSGMPEKEKVRRRKEEEGIAILRGLEPTSKQQ